jgi:uncharacterized protein (DUF433 family)
MPRERIELTHDIMDGKPVIHGTRVAVVQVLRKLGAGMPPRLTPDDLQAAQHVGWLER